MPAWFCPAISHSGGTVPGDPFPPHGLSPWNWPETISSTSTANRPSHTLVFAGYAAVSLIYVKGA
jgi:hypothetical protein